MVSQTNSTYFTNTRKDVLPFIPQTCRALLDIGCGAGEFGALVKRTMNTEVWGVDINEQAAQLATRKLDHVLNAPFLEGLDLPSDYFDVITFNDSLEHFPDPAPPLALCKKMLKTDGVVICSVPNVRYIENVMHFLVDMDWKYEDSGILDRTHLKFFTKKSIARTFETEGYDVLSVTGINPHYWSGKKIFLLRLFFGKWVEDMKFLNYVVTARPKLR